MKPWQVLLLSFCLPLTVLPAVWFHFAWTEMAAAASPRVAVVDLVAVMAEMSRYRAGSVNPLQGSVDADVVIDSLQHIAQERGLLLLAPEAVIAGAEDITMELRRRLRHKGLLPATAAGAEADHVMP